MVALNTFFAEDPFTWTKIAGRHVWTTYVPAQSSSQPPSGRGCERTLTSGSALPKTTGLLLQMCAYRLDSRKKASRRTANMNILCPSTAVSFMTKIECGISKVGWNKNSGNSIEDKPEKDRGQCEPLRDRYAGRHQTCGESACCPSGICYVCWDTFLSSESEREVETRYHQITPVGKPIGYMQKCCGVCYEASCRLCAESRRSATCSTRCRHSSRQKSRGTCRARIETHGKCTSTSLSDNSLTVLSSAVARVLHNLKSVLTISESVAACAEQEMTTPLAKLSSLAPQCAPCRVWCEACSRYECWRRPSAEASFWKIAQGRRKCVRSFIASFSRFGHERADELDSCQLLPVSVASANANT